MTNHKISDIPIQQLSFRGYRLPSDTSRDQRAAFTSLGHWFEAEKFRAFQPDLFQAVMMSPTVKEARKLATKNKGAWRGDWRAVRPRALACGMVYASWADGGSVRWSGSPEQLVATMGPLEFEPNLALTAAKEFVALRDAQRIAFLGANMAPPEVVGKRMHVVHKRVDRAWTLLHWEGRRGCWLVHDWAVMQYVPVLYLGETDMRLNDSSVEAIIAKSQRVVVFEARGGRALDAVIKKLKSASVAVELDLFSASETVDGLLRS